MILKFIVASAILTFYILGHAQKVGIGTTAPFGKLTVAGTDIAGNGIDASIEIRNLASTNLWLLRAGAENTATPANGFSIGDNLAYRFAIDQFGRIGIATVAPRAMMEIFGNSYLGNPDGAHLLLYENEADYSRLRFANSFYNASTHNKYWDIAARTNTAIDGTGDFMQFYRQGLGDVLTLRGDGNVGIGNTNPTARLHVNGGIKINNNNVLEFGAGVAGKESNAGKISYGNYAAHMLELVGGGTNASNRVVRFFNEGYAWFNGPLFLSAGNITRSSSGNAGLLPIAYGEVSSTGSIATSHSTSNFSIIKTGTGVYEFISVDAPPGSRVTVLVTPKAAVTPRIATYTGGFGVDKIIIYIYNISGAPVDGGFSFSIYRPIE